MQRRLLLALATLLAGLNFAHAGHQVQVPPPDLISSYKLDPAYEKCVIADGLPIVGSKKVNDIALLEAAWLIDHMLAKRPEIRASMVNQKVRMAIMAHDEYTTAVPEHRTLVPGRYWDKRARGLGASPHRPAVSCGEENLLCLPGDPYGTENILIHEFGHALHQMGLNQVDPTFDRRLEKCYREAMKAGLWKGKYASVNHMEYWAEGVQSWFDTNRENDHDHNHVNTREEIKTYDPELSKLLLEVFGDDKWRYQRPEKRDMPEHFKGYDWAGAPKFDWPKELNDWTEKGLSNPDVHPTGLKDIAFTPLADKAPPPNSTEAGGGESGLIIANATTKELSIAWVDHKGELHPHGFVRPGFVSLLETHPGHVWLVTEEDGTPIGFTTAEIGNCRAVVK